MKKLSLLAVLSIVVLLAGCVNTNPSEDEIAEDVAGVEYTVDTIDVADVENETEVAVEDEATVENEAAVESVDGEIVNE